jgi:hypothetical protein
MSHSPTSSQSNYLDLETSGFYGLIIQSRSHRWGLPRSVLVQISGALVSLSLILCHLAKGKRPLRLRLTPVLKERRILKLGTIVIN